MAFEKQMEMSLSIMTYQNGTNLYYRNISWRWRNFPKACPLRPRYCTWLRVRFDRKQNFPTLRDDLYYG